MLEKYYFNPSDQADLNVYRCGIETCKPGYTWGPGVRDHFIVHCVLDGTGTFSDGTQEWKLKGGDGFVIFPGRLVTYKADREEPWTYSWVGFSGRKAGVYLGKAGLHRETPVFFHRNDNRITGCVDAMISDARLDTPSELMLLGHLYTFISLLIRNNQSMAPAGTKSGNREKYCSRAIDFISRNYSGKISIQDIASNMGLDRSYLYTIFMQTMNMSPQDFLIQYRIERAIELMAETGLGIGDISRSVGYDDPLQFSRIFRKKKGISPSLFRQKLIQGGNQQGY